MTGMSTFKMIRRTLIVKKKLQDHISITTTYPLLESIEEAKL